VRPPKTVLLAPFAGRSKNATIIRHKRPLPVHFAPLTLAPVPASRPAPRTPPPVPLTSAKTIAQHTAGSRCETHSSHQRTSGLAGASPSPAAGLASGVRILRRAGALDRDDARVWLGQTSSARTSDERRGDGRRAAHGRPTSRRTLRRLGTSDEPSDATALSGTPVWTASPSIRKLQSSAVPSCLN
jgi:hypothetical protein